MKIIFYSVYNNFDNRALDLLNICISTYNKTNSLNMNWIIFYRESESCLTNFNNSKINIIFKKIKNINNNLKFKSEIINDFPEFEKLADIFCYKIKCVELLSKSKYDLICHVDLDIIFLKDLTKIYSYCINSNDKIFGTLSYNFDSTDYSWLDKSIFKNGYLSLGFTIFKPQKIYNEFLNSKYLKTYIVDESFLSVYKKINNIKNLQLYKKNDVIDNYYILHLSHCGLTYPKRFKYMQYYYSKYKKEVLQSDASENFKRYIKYFYKFNL